MRRCKLGEGRDTPMPSGSTRATSGGSVLLQKPRSACIKKVKSGAATRPAATVAKS